MPAPANTPPVPPAVKKEDKALASTVSSGVTATLSTGWIVFWTIVGLIPWFVYSYGAAKLSYAKFGSVGWSILDFLFAPLYYPYYAYFLDTSSQAIFGGRRRR